jgi:hypothetical protein
MIHWSKEGMGNEDVHTDIFLWVMLAICALHEKLFSLDLARRQAATPNMVDSIVPALRGDGFAASVRKIRAAQWPKEAFSPVAWLSPSSDVPAEQAPDRNQAFFEGYIVGFETVKSLWPEPRLNSRYSGGLASYQSVGFATKQLD